MDSIGFLLDEQARLESKFSDFVTSLDPSRTVTLRQLLSTRCSNRHLRAPWLNVDILEERLRSAQQYLSDLPQHPRISRKSPLIFFQKSLKYEDMQQHTSILRKLKKEDGYVPPRLRMRGKFGVGIDYLHTETNWYFKLDGTWEERNRTIRPLSPFSNWGEEGIFRHRRERLPNASVLGYRVPDYPSLLGVGPDTATEYLARYVIHDIGHVWLPNIGTVEEMLHNGVMICATGAKKKKFADLWEQVVYDECTDPYFMAEAPQRLKNIDSAKLVPAGKFLLGRLVDVYAEGERASHLRMWDIDKEAGLRLMRQSMRRVYEELPQTGFARYAGLKRPPS